MKKIAYILIGCLCTVVLTYSYFAFADQGAATETSKEMTGILTEIPGAQNKIKFTNEAGPQELTIAKSAWVYRDQQKAVLGDLKVGDKLEVIANIKKQAAFIKAYSASSPLPEQQVSVVTQPQPSVSPSATAPIPSVIPPPEGGKGPVKPGATPNPGKTGATFNGGTWEKLSVKANTAELNVEINQAGGISEVYILTKRHEKIVIRGASAEQLIRRLVEGISLQAPTAKQDLLNRIIQEFNLSGQQADLQLDVKWMPNQGMQEQEKDKSDHNKDKQEKEKKKKPHDEDEGKQKD